MAKKLTAGTLKGTSYRETMNVEWKGEEFEIEIRALNNEESTPVEELTQDGINVKAKPGLKGKMTRTMDFDTKKNFRGRRESSIKAVAFGTVDESITEDVVRKEFPPKLIEQIGKRVKQISGISNPEEVKEMSEGEENPSNEG